MSNFWPDEMTVEPIGAWPGALTTDRRVSGFSAPWKSTLDLLDRELFMLGRGDRGEARLQVAISPAQFRNDGRPRVTARAEHPGVILTLESTTGPLSFPCDTFTTWQDNVRAIALALEALRKVDRYGVTRNGEQYRGFLALEGGTAAPAGFASTDEALDYLGSVLGFEGHQLQDLRRSPKLVLRRAQQLTHPDRGGDPVDFQRVSLAEAKLREAGLL